MGDKVPKGRVLNQMKDEIGRSLSTIGKVLSIYSFIKERFPGGNK